MKTLALAAALGGLAVALGAFGAHGLEGRLTPEGDDWWQTATFYLLSHAVMAAAMQRGGEADRSFRLPAILMLAGGAVFAVTLYAMALGAPRVLGAVTPVGGVLMLAGWGLLAFRAASLRPDA